MLAKSLYILIEKVRKFAKFDDRFTRKNEKQMLLGEILWDTSEGIWEKEWFKFSNKYLEYFLKKTVDIFPPKIRLEFRWHGRGKIYKFSTPHTSLKFWQKNAWK